MDRPDWEESVAGDRRQGETALGLRAALGRAGGRAQRSGAKSVRSGMGMANLLVRRLESPQADQTPTNRSFRDLILSGRRFALLKRAGLFGARPAARVAWPEWAAALGDAIKRAQAAGDPDDGSTFYRHWLASLERLV